MTTEFLRDGMTIAEIDRIDSEIRPLLPQGSTKAGMKVRFVGVLATPGGRNYAFLPKGGSRNCPAAALDVARMSMWVTVAYLRFNRRCGRMPAGAGKETLELAAEIADDFLENGLLGVRDTRHGRHRGKPDWAATLAKDTPHIDRKGRPAFATIRTRSSYDDDEVDVSEIHASVIRDVLRTHAWWLGVSMSVIPGGPDGGRSLAEAFDIVESARARSWSSEERRTMDLVEDYLRGGTSGSPNGGHCVGIVDFSAVWEWMLAKVLRNNESSWSKRLPRIAYSTRDGHVVEAGGMRPDIILKNGDELKLVDAKYYAASGADDMPGRNDIRKQHDYMHGLKEIAGKDFRLSNHFAFPSVRDGDGEIREIFHRSADGTVSDCSAPIQCAYVSVEAVMRAVMAGRKIDFPSNQPSENS